MEEKLKCEVCGALVTRKSASQKYCAGCRAEANSFKAKLHREERKQLNRIRAAAKMLILSKKSAKR